MNTQTTYTRDWLELLNALIVLGLTIIISILLILGTQYYYNTNQEWENKQRQTFSQIQAEYTHVQEALEIVNSFYYETFNQFLKDGFFQETLIATIEEQRLKMVADIESLIPQLLLPTPAHYELTQATPYTTPNVTTEKQFKVYETKLILKLGLLHEEDVLKLIEAIEFQQLSGLFNLQQCDIKRTTDKINVKEITKANFEATCILTWYISTIEPEGK